MDGRKQRLLGETERFRFYDNLNMKESRHILWVQDRLCFGLEKEEREAEEREREEADPNKKVITFYTKTRFPN